MRRKKYMGDFITHITRYPTRVDMQHLISLNIIKGVMERMQEDIGEKYSKSSEIEKLETMAEIKMAYIMLYVYHLYFCLLKIISVKQNIISLFVRFLKMKHVILKNG